MGQSELLSLLPSLLSLIVLVAVLIGLFGAITTFVAKYGLILVGAFFFVWFYDPILIIALLEIVNQQIYSLLSL